MDSNTSNKIKKVGEAVLHFSNKEQGDCFRNFTKSLGQCTNYKMSRGAVLE